MSRAEEIHYKAVMAADNQEPPKDYCISAHADHFNGFVEGYVEGYSQAERDLALTWKDMELIYHLSDEIPYMKHDDFFKELLKRYNEKKKELV